MIPIAKPMIGQEEIDAVVSIMKSGSLAQGPKVKEFEEKVASFCGAKFGIAVNSGTAALHASLNAAGIKAGDEVITTPFTFAASSNCIIMQGARPILADIEEDTFNIDAKKIELAFTKKTKGIIPIDLYGQAYDADAVADFAEQHGLHVVEDACQAIGASYRGRMCGTLGELGTFSFYATKNIITAEGGMIMTDNADYAELCRRFRHHGQSEKTRYEYHELGYNYRMTDIAAAIGIAQLKHLSDWTEKRIRNAEFLTKRLSKLDGIMTPVTKSSRKHVYHQYTIRIRNFRLSRDKVVETLRAKGVGCGIYYPKPLHMHPFYMSMGYKPGMFPNAELASKEVVSLPVHPSLSQEDLNAIVAAFEEMSS